MNVITEYNGNKTSVPIKLFTGDEVLDDSVLNQLYNLTTLPTIKGLSIMPDVHLGYGATVGSVIATAGIIAPSAVGVDIGCGMLSLKLKNKIESYDVDKLYDSISKVIPVGKAQSNHTNRIQVLDTHISTASDFIKDRSDKVYSGYSSLGGGNHFCELCSDENGDAWIMLHSGSRGIGNIVGRHHIDTAKEIMKLYHINLLDPDLAYLVENTPEFSNYIADLDWCQTYAFMNRQAMLDSIMRVIGESYVASDVINCHHNYMSRENHYGKNLLVVRKGAIRAREGDLGIIPGSMGQKSYIVTGKGNLNSMCSCSHGAGRAHSRTKAKSLFTLDDLREQTKGVVCRKDDGVLDEIPSAYKDLDTVMENQNDLVNIIHTLKAVLCIKG